MPTQTSIDRVVPPDSFIGRYMASMQPLETALAYDFWSALWVLGSALGRDVYVPRPLAPVYMNWYVILCAESGVTRKSTAVGYARDMVAARGINLVEGRMTPPYLWQQLGRLTVDHGRAELCIAVSELVTFLSRDQTMMQLPAMLTDLYDCPVQRVGGGSVGTGTIPIRNTFVTFLSASTPSWLRLAVNPAVIEGGFTSRCLFVVAVQPKQRVAWPSAKSTDVSRVSSSLSETVAAAREVGRISLMPSAIERFTNWYNRRDISTDDPFTASFNAREDGHVLRMAACLAVNDGSMAVYPRHIEAATKFIREVKTHAVALFQDTGVPAKVSTGISRVVEVLAEHGQLGILRTHLFLRVRHYLSRDEFDIAIRTMHELRMLRILVEATNRPGRDPQRIIRDERLTSRTLHRELRRQLLGSG